MSEEAFLKHLARVQGRPKFGDLFLDFAQALSLRSTCRRLQVGCVIAGEDHRQVYGIGFNGSAAGGPNDCDSEEPGKCGCFVSGTPVTAFGVERAYRRRYVGDVFRIVTRGGEFTVTPNHPILALRRGLLAAENIREGDHLLHPARGENMAARAPDDHQDVAIEDVYEAVRVSGRSVRRAGARHQFHGDGAADEDVDVVSTDRGLRPHAQAGRRERLGEPLLAAAHEEQAPLRATRPSFRAALLGEETGFVEALLHDDAAHPQFARDGRGGLPALVPSNDVLNVHRDHRLALVPAQVLGHLAKHTTLAQALLNRGVGNVEGRRYVDHPLAAHVAADEVVHVERKRWAGHVYNLQTAAGWYCAGNAGTIAQNCIHAEANAIINCTAPRALSKVVYCTNLPCVMCAKMLINLGGVALVVYRHDYRIRDGVEWLRRAGVRVEHAEQADPGDAKR